MIHCDAPRLLKQFLVSRPGLTQSDAADQLGIRASALSQYLKRKQRPKADIRQRIARWSEGAVPEAAWLTAKERNGLADIDAAVAPAPDEAPDTEKKTKAQKPAAA